MSGEKQNTQQALERETMLSTGAIELQLVTAIAGLQADMRHVRETGDRTHEAVTGLTNRVSNLEADVATLKARPSVSGPDPKLVETVSVLVERTANQQSLIDTLRAGLESRALSWPKLLTGLAALVGTIVALGLYTPILK